MYGCRLCNISLTSEQRASPLILQSAKELPTRCSGNVTLNDMCMLPCLKLSPQPFVYLARLRYSPIQRLGA